MNRVFVFFFYVFFVCVYVCDVCVIVKFDLIRVICVFDWGMLLEILDWRV